MSKVSKNVEKYTNLDDVLDKFSIYNCYFARIALMTALIFLSNAVYSCNYVFVAENMNYRCNDSGHYNYNISNNCTQYAYENPNSFVAEFQLGGSEWKRTLVGTAHCFGYMLGLLVVGPLSDKFGRRDIIVATAIFCGIFGLAKSFSPWYWLYIALEFTEAAIGDSCSPTYIFVTELVSRNHRINFILICTFGFVFGGLTLALSAWLVPYWRYLLRVVYTPVLLFVAYKFILIESPRWLFNNGRKQEAISLLEKIAKKTKVKIDKDSLEMITFEDPKEVVFMQILKNTFKSKLLRRRFFVCLSWWITSTFVNYGLAINSVLLQGNKYLNYAFVILMEIPGYFILAYVLNNFKRKLPLIFGFFIAGILCISQPFIPLYTPWLSILIYAIGKLFSFICFHITYLYTSELFPTHTRNSMHALCSSIGRLGSVIAPQTQLLMVYWHGLPALLFGVASLLSGVATFFVPDVCNETLPDTVEQAEQLGKSRSEDQRLS